MEEKNTNFAYIAIVAIVAVVALIVLVLGAGTHSKVVTTTGTNNIDISEDVTGQADAWERWYICRKACSDEARAGIAQSATDEEKNYYGNRYFDCVQANCAKLRPMTALQPLD